MSMCENQISAPPPTVVILLSDKRSGSTVFQDEFSKHPDVKSLGYSSHTYLESHHWLKAAVMLKRPERLFSGSKRYPNYGSVGNARTYMIDTILGNVPDFPEYEDDQALILEGWEALCRRHANPVFFEKSPQVLAHWAALSLLLKWKRTTNCRVKLIGLIRNPLAVMHSSNMLFGSEPEVRQFGWVETYRNLLALSSMLSKEELLVLRHEDILAEPHLKFADICKFVGLNPFSGMGDGISTSTQERWREDEQYCLQLDHATRQIALSFGYSETELENIRLPGRSHRRMRRFSLSRLFNERKNQFRDRYYRPLKMRWQQYRRKKNVS